MLLTRRHALSLLAANALAQKRTPAPAAGRWPQWGGPRRDFTVPDAPPLRASWPAAGPPVVWKRDLGDGYSSVSVDSGVLYTMCNRGGNEITLAADAATGRTLWEHGSPSTFRSAYEEPGNGPYATPLVLADRIITAGVTGKIECRARKDGALLWSRDLWKTHRGTRLDYGYSSSPMAYRDLVIVPCGGPGSSVLAIRAADGAVAWSKLDYANVYSSPILITVDGLEQLVQLLDGHIVGLNPLNGDQQWSVPFQAQYSIAVATPLWTGQLLFISAEYDAGAKAVRLTRAGQQVKPEEVWSSNRLRLHHGNAIHLDGTLYFSSGGKSSVALLTAIEMATGKILWQDRSISKASFIWADRKLITLDQDGNLMLAEPSPKGFKILAKAPLLSNVAWTPPSLAGTRLYLRDRKSLLAVELG
ncbi:MAG: PQQ-binding-like beta-propeller repeat protein [Bryobacteraceae bacterium]|nr:PQQ-binding-like beta-propeller repeat protein [Bryobacteraceae bacterium]